MVDAPDFADLGAGQRVGAGEAASVEVVKSSSAIVFEAEEERAEAPTAAISPTRSRTSNTVSS